MMTDPPQEEANLSKLLSALAVGARAVHSLPVEDDFDYEATFPDFLSLQQEGKTDLFHVLSLALNQELNPNDPAVWEQCADACDYLLEQSEVYLSSERLELTHWSSAARQHAQSAYGRMMEGIVEMVKPQETYNIVVDNGRTTPFVPVGAASSSLVPGRASDTRLGSSPDIVFLENGLIGPTHFVPHAKRKEILALECTYPIPTTKPRPIKDTEDLVTASHIWVDTKKELSALAKTLSTVSTMAVDLEAHSYRSFAGMVCLMQITVELSPGKCTDYLVDTLALWHDIPKHLGPAFANSKILKVMHGADSDIVWLQRDFGIYVVNLLDTGRAARLLKLSSFGLAHLLKTYAKVDADKTHQMSDWRQRPLPDDMQLYAKMDTHYLLIVAKQLLWEIDHHSTPEVTVQKLFEDSRQVSLIRYDKEVFRVNGYKTLMNRKRSNAKTELSETQEEVLCALYDWRDLCARNCDESPFYVCSNMALLRLALSCPTTVTTLQSLLNPMPPLVLRFAQDILDRINQVLNDNKGLNDGPPSAAFFKPAEPETDETPRGLLSPVLGTEALYKQAGWMTPSLNDSIHASTEEDPDDMDGTKPKNLLLVDKGNKEYRASSFTSHSLAMGSLRGKTADGLGAASGLSDKVEEAAERAQRSANNVRKSMGESDLLGLFSASADVDEEVDEDREEEEDDKENDDSEAEFEVPRSMREIYKVSNRNRRNKKVTSPQTTEGEVPQGEKMEVDTIEGAEKLLAARGTAYFDSVINKRQKHDDHDSENQVSQEEDVAFMQQIGWIKDQEEAEALKPRPRGDSEDFDVDEGKPTEKETNRAFDYSTVGNIGVYDPSAPPAANPFFAGAAVAGAGFNQGSSGPRRDKQAKRGGKGKAGRGGRQERPQKNDGKSIVYKKK